MHWLQQREREREQHNWCQRNASGCSHQKMTGLSRPCVAVGKTTQRGTERSMWYYCRQHARLHSHTVTRGGLQTLIIFACLGSVRKRIPVVYLVVILTLYIDPCYIYLYILPACWGFTISWNKNKGEKISLLYVGKS